MCQIRWKVGAQPEKVVNVSDEAFAILVFENDIDKWVRKFNCEQQGERGEDTNEIERRIRGRYTAGTTTRAANIKYGGWSDEGLIRFNQLCRLVAIDLQNEHATQMEEQVLQRLREKRYGRHGDNDNMETDEMMLQWEPVESFVNCRNRCSYIENDDSQYEKLPVIAM